MPTARPRARTTAHRTLGALTVVTALAVLSVGPPALADDASSLTFTDDPRIPIQVGPTDQETPEPVYVSLRNDGEQQQAEVTASGPGLDVDEPTRTVTLRPGDNTVRFDVSASTTGLHTLTATATATAAGEEPTTEQLPYVWRAGGAPLPGGGDLTGRSYSVNGTADDYSTSEGFGYRYSRVISFVDDTYAVHGLPGHRGAVCGSAGTSGSKTCKRYHFDPSTGLVQVGSGVIGQLVGASYLDGATPAVPEDTDEYYDGQYFQRLVLPRPGGRYPGHWRFSSSYHQGVFLEDLLLRQDGTYRASVRAGVGGEYGFPASILRRDWAGRYTVGQGGRLTLRDRSNHTTYTVARLALGVTDDGANPGAGRRVQLEVTLKIKKGKRAGTTLVDGNLLRPTS